MFFQGDLVGTRQARALQSQRHMTLRPSFAGLAILALLAALVAGCVGTLTPVDDDDTGGGGDDDTGGGSVARQMFDDDVAPLLQATCASCHAGTGGVVAPKFLGTTGITGYYANVVGQTALVGAFNPAAATLLTKGAHSSARAWTTTESDTITMWLLAEADERP